MVESVLMPRLSVIVPALSGALATESAVRSVFNQADPIGIEVIVSASSSSETRSHLEAAFPRQVSSGILRFACGEKPSFDLGAAAAGGNFLAFLDSRDQWLYGRLIELWPLLEDFDLILSPSQAHSSSEDWLREYLARRQGSVSSAVVRRSLFDAAGGFARSEYELWLRCLGLLERSGRRKRFLALPAHNIRLGYHPPASPRADAIALARALPALPRSYWGAALRSSLSRFMSFM